MKKISLLLVVILISTNIVAQNPVPNPGFESWSGTPLVPDGWNTNNAGTSNVLVIQDAANTGSYSARGRVISFNNDHFVAPYLGCYFPVSELYTSMEFFYKAILDSGDLVNASIGIYDSLGGFVALNFVNLTSSDTSFTHYSLSIDSVAPGIPVNALIVFTINPAPGDTVVHAASYFIVDDVELLSPTSGIIMHEKSEPLSVMPNPASEFLFIESSLQSNNPVQLMLTDAFGKVVLEKYVNSPNGILSAEVNIESVSAGIYFLTVHTTNYKSCKKVVIY